MANKLSRGTVCAFVVLSVTGPWWIWESVRGRLSISEYHVVLMPAEGDGRVVGEVDLINTGWLPVHVKSIRSSCGCVVSSAGAEVIGARSSAKLEIVGIQPDFDSKARAVVNIESSDPINPIQSIYVVLNGGAAVSSYPDELVIDGDRQGVVDLYGIGHVVSDCEVQAECDFLEFAVDRRNDGAVRVTASVCRDSLSGYFRVPIELISRGEVLWRGAASGTIDGCYKVIPSVAFPIESSRVLVSISDICRGERFEVVDLVAMDDLGLALELVQPMGPNAMISCRRKREGGDVRFGTVLVKIRCIDDKLHDVVLSVSPQS